MNILRISLVLSFCLPFFCSSQIFEKKDKKESLVKVSSRTSGTYFGLQAGRYYVPEIGKEFQWKQVRFKDAETNALHFGFNYNLKYNVLGYDVGYWYRAKRLGLTYGANIVFRTDFTYNNIGFVPVVGYKIAQLHFQTGYHFLAPRPVYETNGFFVSIRWVIVTDRDIDVEFRKRKKKKD